MAFVHVTLLTISVVALLAIGGFLVRASRARQHDGALRWCGAGVLCLGLGMALLLAAPTDLHAPVRIFGNALILLATGLLWAAARTVNRNRTPFEVIVAGILAWLVLVSVFDPSAGWRIGVTSVLVAGYSAATAWEYRTGDTGAAPARRWASWLFAGHGLFFLVRALLGPFLSFGAVMGLEMAAVAAGLGIVSIAMNRERVAEAPQSDTLEDPLTGIGNRRALFRSGGALLDAMRRSNRPTAVLLMDLDGFKAVNDRHGHRAADALLVAFARLAHDYLPSTSLVCRIGGDVFGAVLPGADTERAQVVADEIRSLFAHLVLTGPEGPVRTTVSIGIGVDEASPIDSAMAEAGTGPTGSSHPLSPLLSQADMGLDAAKNAGRDQVAVGHAAGHAALVAPRAAA